MIRQATAEWDGPNLVVVLFVVSLAFGLLVGLGASRWGPHPDAGTAAGARHATPVSRKAAQLGYVTQHDYAADQQLAASALVQVLQANPGTQRLWENAETGNRGVIWSSPETSTPDGSTCRELARRTLINNAYRNANATACRRPGKVWASEAQWRNE